MIVITSQEMRQLDHRTVEDFHVPISALMENAGLRLVEEIEKRWGPVSGKTIAVIAGKGNNGGDGLVAARHLRDRSAQASVYLTVSPESIQGEARKNLDRFRLSSGPIHLLHEKGHVDLAAELSKSDLIIDALLGTGLSSTVSGLTADTITAINTSGKPVLAVDIPSGIHGDTGHVMGVAVKAVVTVTFALPKRGLLMGAGVEHAGQISVCDIGIPQDLIRQIPSKLHWQTSSEIALLLKHRAMNSHKGSFGHVLVIAGSAGKGGAAVMASLSALRVGAGVVTLAIPSGLEAALPDRPSEIMTLPLPETSDKTLGNAALEPLLKFSQDKNVAAIGPGLSTHPETTLMVHALITRLSIPMVIDADGLNALVGHLDLLKEARVPIVLTPHPGEMARLTGTSSQTVQANRLDIASDFVRQHPVTLVLKGARTLIADQTGILTINSTGNPGMATAGTGDVLTGIIAGLIGQGYPPGIAAALGAYLHGLAGDMAAVDIGGIGLLAGDLIHRIPAAITKGLGQ